ncbi:MAG: PQQ-dependent sugar dehydrogenase [Roseivirga sp.]|nr:PQQ-dependent sugar dehydrogenase [Roseivirga sp.]
MKKGLSIFFFTCLAVISCHAQNDPRHANILPDAKTVSYELVLSRLNNPWGFVFLPNGEMLITEKSGNIKRTKGDQVLDSKVKGGPESTRQGQGGLMDIALHPDFGNNSWVYFTYASSEGSGSGAMTAVSRAKWNGTAFTDHTVLYKGSPNTRAGQHFGSRLAFDRDGYLYFSIGDRGQRDVNPQDITRDGGKIYRIHDDGRIPDDNPFADLRGAKKAIFSYGHRNPQGMAQNPITGDIWAHEHGPRGGDEVNLIRKGRNYGWPVISYGINYSGTSFTDITEKEGMEQPVSYWKPSIAPCGMDFLANSAYSGWDGDLIVGSLKFSYLVRCVIEDNKIVRQERIAEGIGRVRSVKQGPDGYLYVGVEGKGLYKLIPAR